MKKQDIVDDIKKITDEVISYVETLTYQEVTNSIDGKWSVNGNIEHLTKLIKPLTKAIKKRAKPPAAINLTQKAEGQNTKRRF